MSILLKHLPDNRSGSKESFSRPAEFMADPIKRSMFHFHLNDIGSGTNENLLDLPKFCLVQSVGPALNHTSVFDC